MRERERKGKIAFGALLLASGDLGGAGGEVLPVCRKTKREKVPNIDEPRYEKKRIMKRTVDCLRFRC